MKEILKNICKKSLEKAYEQNLKSVFTSFFYKSYKDHDVEYIPRCDKDRFMVETAKEVLESFVSEDFSVSKMTSDLMLVEEFANSTFGTSLCVSNIDVTIYNILEKDLNIVIIDDIDILSSLDSYELNSLIEEYFKDLCHCNIENYGPKNKPEIYNPIYYGENMLVLNVSSHIFNMEKFQYTAKCSNDYANLQYVLNILYGENDKTKNYQKIIESYLLELNRITKMGLKELYKDNKEKFLQIVIPIFIKKSTLKLHIKEQQVIYNYLYTNKDIDKVIQLILTFQYTSQLNNIVTYHNNLGFSNVLDFLDFSFTAVQMFKLVEIVFYNLLNEFWNTNNIIDKYGKVDITDDRINLGKMKQFFDSTDIEIVAHLKQKREHNNNLQGKLTKWISETRNGFLHKHILPKETLDMSITDSIDIVCLLILVLIK